MNLERFMIAEESLSFKMISMKISPAIKTLIEKLKSFFKKKAFTATEGVEPVFYAIDEVCDWASENMKKLRMRDKPNYFHLDINDSSDEMRCAIYFTKMLMDELNKNPKYKDLVKIQSHSFTENGETKHVIIAGLMDEDRKNNRFVALGVPVIWSSIPFFELHNLMKNHFSGDTEKITMKVQFEIHWNISKPTDIDTSMTGSHLVEVFEVSFSPK